MGVGVGVGGGFGSGTTAVCGDLAFAVAEMARTSMALPMSAAVTVYVGTIVCGTIRIHVVAVGQRRHRYSVTAASAGVGTAVSVCPTTASPVIATPVRGPGAGVWAPAGTRVAPAIPASAAATRNHLAFPDQLISALLGGAVEASVTRPDWETKRALAIFPEAMAERLANRPCGGRYGDIVQAIGNTPLVELKRLSPKPGVRIWAKLESHNPTGSVKDRVARALIEDAEEKGAILPGQTILEPTSGNTGISLAMICARKGYRLKVVMPDNVTPERTQLLQMYGAEIIYSPGGQGSNGAVAMALELAASDASYYMPYQYGNPANPNAHYHGTAPEIIEELDEVTAFVAGLGTGGTLMGNGRRLREEFGDAVKIVAAEPMQGEPVQGLRSLDDGFIPPIIDLSLLDRKIFVTNHDAIVWTRRLLDEEGIFAGVSSGAIASIAVRIANELDEGNVVFIVCDDGWKYLSSGIYTRPLDEIENVDSTVWW